MKIFRVNKDIEIVCRAENTRTGFRHLATLIIGDDEVDKAKCTYINRTWERYEFESVMAKLAQSPAMTDWQRKRVQSYVHSKKRVENSLKPLKTIASVMALGDVLTSNQKESNDWKKRMLKAGLESRGLIMPEDWDTLDEDTKTARLNGAIKFLK